MILRIYLIPLPSPTHALTHPPHTHNSVSEVDRSHQGTIQDWKWQVHRPRSTGGNKWINELMAHLLCTSRYFFSFWFLLYFLYATFFIRFYISSLLNYRLNFPLYSSLLNSFIYLYVQLFVFVLSIYVFYTYRTLLQDLNSSLKLYYTETIKKIASSLLYQKFRILEHGQHYRLQHWSVNPLNNSSHCVKIAVKIASSWFHLFYLCACVCACLHFFLYGFTSVCDIFSP